MFAVLSAVLVSAGLWLAMQGAGGFAGGAWLTGGALLAFAVLGRALVAREARVQKAGAGE